MAYPSPPLVLVEDAGDYGVITLNRPDKRNAMSREAQRQFRAALETCLGKKVVVITGAGEISFCAGVDLAEQRAGNVPGERAVSQGGNSWFETQEQIRRHPAVFIAAVNGFALGGGLTLVNNCELAIASSAAEFGLPEIGFGSFPGLSGPSTTKRILPKHAAQLIFTGTRVNADTALRWGLVNEVVAPAEVLRRARELAQHIAQFDEVVLDYGKKAFRAAYRLEWSEAIDYGLTISEVIRASSGAERRGLDEFMRGTRGPGQGTGSGRAEAVPSSTSDG